MLVVKIVKSRNRIKITYAIHNVPNNVESSKVIADIEGKLQIFIGSKLFFDEKNVLLLELAVIAEQWLEKINRNAIIDFNYESMDYEERAILQFSEKLLGKWSIYSVWQKYSSKDVFELNEITKALKKYVDELKSKFF